MGATEVGGVAIGVAQWAPATQAPSARSTATTMASRLRVCFCTAKKAHNYAQYLDSGAIP